MRKFIFGAAQVVCWLLIFLGAVLLGAASWIRRTFGDISVDQMLLHLPGAGGAETTGAESGYVSSFIWNGLVWPFVGVAVLAAVYYALRLVLRWRAEAKQAVLASFSDSDAAQASARPWGVRLAARAVPTLFSIAAFVLGGAVFAHTISLAQYIQSTTTTLTMDSYYATPAVASLEDPPENLILIYLESMEDAFSDDSLFEENMLAPIEHATKGWQQIDELRQYDGGGWTMAGITGTQCGVPLRGVQTAVAGKLELIGSETDAYLPGARCLGDVLADEGYQNVFMGGADASFASKRLFLSTHGYDEVLDLNTWTERGDAEISDWGLSDRALMEHAREEVDRLHASGQPFNLTMLTLDTHEPAHVYDYCPVTTDVLMTSITRCSMEQVAGFIEYLEEQGYLEDTAVVLMGDHERFISEGSDYQELLNLDSRTIFNRMWTPRQVSVQHNQVDQLSMQATMLDLMGIEVEGGRAGLGVSALAAQIAPGSLFDLAPEVYAEVVRSRSSDLYSKLWGLEPSDNEGADYFDPKQAVAESTQAAAHSTR